MADVPLIRNIGMKRNFVVAAECIKSVAFNFTFEFKANCNKMQNEPFLNVMNTKITFSKVYNLQMSFRTDL